MERKSKGFLRWFLGRLGAKLGVGLLAIVPLAATLWLIYWIFTRVDSLLQPAIKALWGWTIPGVGFAITVVFIILLGYFASNVVGKTIIRKAESLTPWMPIFHELYTGIKQILDSFMAVKGTSRMQPVLLEYPRKGMKTMGFITNEIVDKDGKRLLMVFVPTVPNPTTGFLQIVEESEVTRMNIPLDDALKMAISAGKVVPKDVEQALLKLNWEKKDE